jgi:hypothetical protein
MKNVKFSDFLTEAPLPDDWDAAMYNERVPFSRRVAYAKERAKRIGSGSSRIAFVIPYNGHDTVLKIAKNRKGMAQNEAEVQMLEDWYLKDLGLFIPMIDYDEQGNQPTWIHTELAQKAKESDFVNQCGGTVTDLISWATRQHNPRQHGYGNPDAIDPESELAQKFNDFVGNFRPNVADYNNVANWGLYKGELVIIDAGYNDEVKKLYYK